MHLKHVKIMCTIKVWLESITKFHINPQPEKPSFEIQSPTTVTNYFLTIPGERELILFITCQGTDGQLKSVMGN